MEGVEEREGERDRWRERGIEGVVEGAVFVLPVLWEPGESA